MVLAPRLGVWTISFFDLSNFDIETLMDIYIEIVITYVFNYIGMMKSYKNYKK